MSLSVHDLQQKGRPRPGALTAPTRRIAAFPPVRPRTTTIQDLWWDAAGIRQEWLGHGLSTQPAERQTAEENLTAIYARLSRPRPSFVWVASPREALGQVAGRPTLEQLYLWGLNPRGRPPLVSDLATMVAQLRARLSATVSHTDPELSPVRRSKDNKPWPVLAPLDALALGVPTGVVLHQGVHTALHRSLGLGVRNPIRNVLSRNGPMPVCWYGQQEAHWIAYYDMLSRLGLAHYVPGDATHLAEWAAVARSCSWWWPGEDVCVVADRPEHLDWQTVPGAVHGEVRLRRDGVRYRDGWSPHPG